MATDENELIRWHVLNPPEGYVHVDDPDRCPRTIKQDLFVQSRCDLLVGHDNTHHDLTTNIEWEGEADVEIARYESCCILAEIFLSQGEEELALELLRFYLGKTTTVSEALRAKLAELSKQETPNV